MVDACLPLQRSQDISGERQHTPVADAGVVVLGDEPPLDVHFFLKIFIAPNAFHSLRNLRYIL